jgi:hypothetical protein
MRWRPLPDNRLRSLQPHGPSPSETCQAGRTWEYATCNFLLSNTRWRKSLAAYTFKSSLTPRFMFAVGILPLAFRGFRVLETSFGSTFRCLSLADALWPPNGWARPAHFNFFQYYFRSCWVWPGSCEEQGGRQRPCRDPGGRKPERLGAATDSTKLRLDCLIVSGT